MDTDIQQRLLELRLKLVREGLQSSQRDPVSVNQPHHQQQYGMQVGPAAWDRIPSYYVGSGFHDPNAAMQYPPRALGGNGGLASLLVSQQRQLQTAQAQLASLQDQVRAAHEQHNRRQRSAQLAALAATVDKLAEMKKPADAESKVDVIMAQMLQIQTIMLSQMAGTTNTSMRRPQDEPGGTSSLHHQSAIQVQQDGQQPKPLEPSPLHVARDEPALTKSNMPAQAGAGNDDVLLKKIMELSEELSKAEEMAKHSAETAVAAAAAAVTQAQQQQAVDPQSPQRPQNAVAEEGVVEEELETVEQGDEMLQEEMETYHDVALAWLRKSLKVIVSNVLTEQQTAMHVQEPFKGTVFTKGLTQQDVDVRLLKLGVRCRAVTHALDQAIHARAIPEPLKVFFRRLVASGQTFPQSFLLEIERQRLGLEAGANKVGEVLEEDAKFLLAQFLWVRIMVGEIMLKPWACGVGPQIPAGKQVGQCDNMPSPVNCSQALRCHRTHMSASNTIDFYTFEPSTLEVKWHGMMQ
jgi:hypothetical protein